MPARKRLVKKIVLRRECEATRKRRQQLAKERQGQDGKWETNKKKAAFFLAKRKTLRVDGLLQDTFQRLEAEQAATLKEAVRLTSELKSAADAPAVLRAVAALETLSVSAKVLKHTLLPRVLTDAAAKHSEAKEVVARLKKRWRDLFREDVARQRDRASSPSAVVAAARTQEAAGWGEAADRDSGSQPRRGQADHHPHHCFLIEAAPAAPATPKAPASRRQPLKQRPLPARPRAKGEAHQTSAARSGAVPAKRAMPAQPASTAPTGVAPPKARVSPVMPVKRQRPDAESSTSSEDSEESSEESVVASPPAASTPVPHSAPASRMVATPQGKPARKPARQVPLTAFLKGGQVV